MFDFIEMELLWQKHKKSQNFPKSIYIQSIECPKV